MNVSDVILTFLLAAGIEFVTVVLRLVWHLKSANVQRKVHWPRTHHAYLGAALVILTATGVLVSFMAPRIGYLIGGALIISDIVHHAALVPLLRRYRYDLRMVHHEAAHRYLVRWSAFLLIIVGFIALLTPFTPGSWLMPMGFVTLVGRRRARRFVRALTGRSLYRTFRLASLFGDD